MHFALLLLLIPAQCGPEGCTLPSRAAPQRLGVVRPVAKPAVLDIEVIPPDGQVWLDGYQLRSLKDGKTRIETAPLEPLPAGYRYRYRVQVRWADAEREFVVRFSPGEHVRLVLRRDDSPPAKPPGGDLPVVEEDGVQNFGIDRTKLNGSEERITLDGREITLAEAVRYLQGSGLTDDSGKLRLTVIGPEADRRRVVEDLRGPLSDVASQCLVQDYPPDHWAVTGAGFYTGGKPTIYVQAPDGTVLHRQDDYADGAEGFRAAFERLRKPDPNYRPDKDRDLRRGGDSLLNAIWRFLTAPFRVVLSWVLALGLVYLLIVGIAKGWLWYFLRLLARLIPRAPTTAEVNPASQTTAVAAPAAAGSDVVTSAAERLAELVNQQMAKVAAAKETAVAEAINKLVDTVAAKLKTP